MARITFLLAFCFSVLNSIGQKESKFRNDSLCIEKWQYFSIHNSVKGEVLFHAKAPFACGGFATVSLTIVKTITNDTIRVLDLCNITKDFKKFTTVKIFPAKRPKFGVIFPADENTNCSLLKTCYGSVSPDKK